MDIPTLSIHSQSIQEIEEIHEKPKEIPVATRIEIIPLWEEAWPEMALREKYESMGPREFDRGFRQRAISDSDLLFSQPAIDAALDKSIVVPDHVEPGGYWHQHPRDAGVDLAIATEDREAAFFALMGVMTTREWHRWIIHLEFTRGLGWGQQISLIAECHDRYMYDIITVERNGFQDSMVRYFQEEGQQRPIPVRGLYTGAAQKKDIEVGIPGMAVEFESGRWHIPYGNGRSRRMMEPLIEELRSYPSPGFHNDAVMAMFFAREARRLMMRPKPRIRMLG